MSNIIEQYVVHLESQDLAPARRSVASEVRIKATCLEIGQDVYDTFSRIGCTLFNTAGVASAVLPTQLLLNSLIAS